MFENSDSVPGFAYAVVLGAAVLGLFIWVEAQLAARTAAKTNRN